MHTFLDSKAMAKALRTALAERQIDITHSESLELVARQFGFDDWNMLAARIEAGRPRKLPHGWHIHHGAGYPLFEAGIDHLSSLLHEDDGAHAHRLDAPQHVDPAVLA